MTSLLDRAWPKYARALSAAALCTCSLATSACDLPDRAVVDEGQLCVTPDQVATFSSGDDLDLEIRNCISACSEDAQATCSATVQGDVIRVVSQGSWSETSGGCIALCESLTATCTVNDLEPGTYTIEHGEDHYTLDLPSQDFPTCPQPD